jgi:hypothetical protein
MQLIPAYGRDYASRKEIQKDFDDDMDFMIADISNPYDGRYVNKQQVVQLGIKSVMIRYNKLRKVAAIAVK